MNLASTTDLCPFCGAPQPPAAERLARCRRCNLYLTRNSSGVLPDALDDQSRDFCPWCAFPVAREHSLPESGEFVCPGCAGTLTVDMLETQTAIDRYRKRRLPAAGYLVFILLLLGVIALTWWWIRPR